MLTFLITLPSWLTRDVIVIAAAALAVIILLVIIVSISKRNKKKRQQKLTGAQIDNGYRYSTESETVKHDDTPAATFVKGDTIVSKGQTIVAGKFGDLLAGKYTLLTSSADAQSFNIRVNGFVREYRHNSTIILGDGDTFCPVSHTVVLR